MKKLLMCFVVLATFMVLPLFAQEAETEEKGNDEISFSILNEKYLINVQNYFSDASYQTPNGEKIKHKEVSRMLLNVPSNEKVMKQYRGWSIATWTLVGIACAGLTTNVVYTLKDDLPYAENIQITSSWIGCFSLFGSLFTSSVASSKYKIAVDNYNLDLLGIK